jgi:hypothetical protein
MMENRPGTRQELVQYLDEVMNSTYSSLVERQELEPDTSLVKTYLVESHLPEDVSVTDLEAFINNLSTTRLPRNRRIRIKQSADRTLYWLTATVNREPVTIYLDVSNPRFWLLHSANRSISLDWLLDRLIKDQNTLDRGWLWPELLERLSTRGVFRGLGLDYDRRVIPDIDFESPESVEYLKLQLWGMQASQVFRVLREAFPQATTLSKVKVKHWLSQDTDGEFAIDDIKYDGKITTRGTSFQSHLELTSDLFREYANTIRRIESDYALMWPSDSGRITISGQALSFRFSAPIHDLDQFCEHVFSSSLPFRLWGTPTKLRDDFYRVAAVDLHAGCRLSFEIAPEYMRLYLPTNSCGNTIVRLYTNLKHHYDPRMRAASADGESIL